MYKPINIQNASPEQIKAKLEEAQSELAIYSNNPLIEFYKGLKIQLEGITEELTSGCLINLKEVSKKGEMSMSDKVLDIIYKSEKLVQLIDNIGTKNFPEIFMVEGVDESRSTESYVTKRDKQLGRDGKRLPSQS